MEENSVLKVPLQRFWMLVQTTPSIIVVVKQKRKTACFSLMFVFFQRTKVVQEGNLVKGPKWNNGWCSIPLEACASMVVFVICQHAGVACVVVPFLVKEQVLQVQVHAGRTCCRRTKKCSNVPNRKTNFTHLANLCRTKVIRVTFHHCTRLTNPLKIFHSLVLVCSVWRIDFTSPTEESYAKINLFGWRWGPQMNPTFRRFDSGRVPCPWMDASERKMMCRNVIYLWYGSVTLLCVLLKKFCREPRSITWPQKDMQLGTKFLSQL